MQVIEAVRIDLASLDERLNGASIDVPRSGFVSDEPGVRIAGWVLGRHLPAVAVELLKDGGVFRRLPLGTDRPDVAAAFPSSTDALRAGFHANVFLLGLGDHSIAVRAVLADHTRIALATLHFRRQWVEDTRLVTAPLVSIIIPCFRQALFLGDAIESVCRQTYPHVEIVVVDDGSPDNTAAVAQQFPGIQLVRQPNMGLNEARNTGIRHSHGDFLVFLDADDTLLPGAVEAGLKAFHAHPDAAFVFGRHVNIAFDGTLINEPDYRFGGDDAYEALLGTEYIECLSTVLFRRSAVDEAGGFRTAAKGCGDFDLYLRVAQRHACYYHGALIMGYRRHGANMSGDGAFTFRHSLPVLRSHKGHAATVKAYRRAYNRGIRFRKDYGRAFLVNAVACGLAERAPGAVRNLAQLVRWHPLGVLRAIRQYLAHLRLHRALTRD
jgi:glycosyltransferase involved in cell wall biosynthesis